MSAEREVIDFVSNALFMSIQHVGPNVFVYDIDQLVPEFLPGIIIKITSSEKLESSTFKNIYKNIAVEITICTGRNNDFYNIKTLFNIRQSISNILESYKKTSSIIDLNEISASKLTADTSTETNLLKQEIIYEFMCREQDR